MFTRTHLDYLAICADKIKLKCTNEQLAENHDCNRSRVDRAIRFGIDCGYFTFELEERLSRWIADLRDDVSRLERDLKRHRRLPKNLDKAERFAWRPNYRAVTALSRVMLDHKTRLMELEGVYRQVLNIQVNGELKVKTYVGVSPDDWDHAKPGAIQVPPLAN